MSEHKKEQKQYDPEDAKQEDDIEELEIPNGFECALSLELMKDPVMAADGHSYEKSQIEDWFKQGKTTSPKTNEELAHLELKPNINLKQSIEEFLKLQAVLKQSKIQEKQASQAAAAALLREQALQKEHQDMKSTVASQALLLSQQGIAHTGVLKAQQRLGHAVLEFVKAVDEHIKTLLETDFHPQAAASAVGGVISALVKGGDAYNRLLEEPQQHSTHPALIVFIEQYVKQHSELWELRTQVDFTRSLKASLYRGELAELNQRFAEKPAQEEIIASSASTLPPT